MSIRTHPVIVLKNGQRWPLTWSEEYGRWIYKARKYTYGLFIDHVTDRKYDWVIPDVWIGVYNPPSEYNPRGAWCTCEREIGAKEIHMDRGVFTFGKSELHEVEV
jgi:hypothetical protein